MSTWHVPHIYFMSFTDCDCISRVSMTHLVHLFPDSCPVDNFTHTTMSSDIDHFEGALLDWAQCFLGANVHQASHNEGHPAFNLSNASHIVLCTSMISSELVYSTGSNRWACSVEFSGALSNAIEVRLWTVPVFAVAQCPESEQDPVSPTYNGPAWIKL
ncbi:hypothetical protein AG1IA_04763 [Rhizoctonia solani AG-1 IA]|uniref:Uncharacterized protein n=1 Tax=Thanatephorus cucumeris (strain AG1-IA) TaxID=983506 RepID=L8WSV4_THACA|nr:hypothetical protein AG1IA_04763 [Rhizoctonia solani AG-1 IA]